MTITVGKVSSNASFSRRASFTAVKDLARVTLAVPLWRRRCWFCRPVRRTLSTSPIAWFSRKYESILPACALVRCIGSIAAIAAMVVGSASAVISAGDKGTS